MRADIYSLSLIELDREDAQPLYRQIYAGIRAAILERQLAPGTRLPSSRDLADLLGVSRNTVVNAFEQLLAEGYLEARVGAGTYVSSRLPETFLRTRNRPKAPAQASGTRRLSELGRAFARYSPSAQPPYPVFPHSVPDTSAFPFSVWARLASRRYREAPRHLVNYGQDPAGYRPLRAAIAAHLRAARAVRCEPEQIVIVAGSQQALYLTGQILLDEGDRAWIENPGYGGARNTLRATGAELVPVPVDEEGLDVGAGEAVAAKARLAYVTPSHQFPLGWTMSLPRRFRLLQWAERNNAWILEDDYDSEFRYDGPPLASLQGLDSGRRVIYTGTFSKILFPGLRIGYVVAPPDLVDAFIVVRSMVSLFVPGIQQAVLADFIEAGHFTRHIRRMRTRYKARRAALVEAIESELGGALTPGPLAAGLHVTAWLPTGKDAEAIARAALAHEVLVTPLSRLALQPLEREGVVLGFASATPAEIRKGVRQLAQILSE